MKATIQFIQVENRILEENEENEQNENVTNKNRKHPIETSDD